MYYTILMLFVSQAYAWNFFSSESDQPEDTFRKAELYEAERRKSPPICLSRQQQVKQNRYTCPLPKDLYKNGMRWTSDGGWKSYQDSFSSEINAFMGAQWKGVGVGRIICLYKSNDPNDFSIQLANTVLITKPNYPMWENNPGASTLNCISSRANPCDCQFSLYTKDEETDLDTIIKNLKKK